MRWTHLAVARRLPNLPPAITLLIAFALLARSASADEPLKTVTIDDHFTLGFLNEIAISSNAEAVAYTEGRWQESTNDRKTDVWIVPYSDRIARRITFDRAGYDTLRWNWDGKYLYCASKISLPGGEPARQVVRIAADGSSTVPVTRVPGGIDAFELSPDGNYVVYTTSSDDDSADWSALRSKFPKLKYGTRKRAKTKFHLVHLVTFQTTELAEYAGAVDGFSVALGAQRIAMVTAPDGSVISMEGQSKLTVLDPATGKATDLPDELWRAQAPSKYGRLNSPKWSIDGEALAFSIGFDGYPSEIFVASWQGEGEPKLRKIRRPGTISLHGGVDGGTSLAWQGRSHDLCFLGDDHARVKVYRAKDAPGGGPVECLIDGDVVIDQLVWDREGEKCAVIQGTPQKMNDVHLYESDAKESKQLTWINLHALEWKLPKIMIVKWSGKDGKPVEGVLEVPPDYKPGKPLPTIVNLHGGPTFAWTCNMVYGYTGSVLFASQGYAFFSPNYRGSTGYGDEFISDLIGKENDVDVSDILAGIDELIADGVCDKDRIAVAGWSNGGYLTNCLISKTDRFKAASCGAGIVDHAMEWGTNDEPAYAMVFKGGPPWHAPELYRRSSPIYQFGAVKTPTLFHVGENDPRCPKGQSVAAHRALTEYLKVESELIIYPGEEHGLGKYDSRKAKLAWELAWFDHFLKGKPKK